MTPHLQKAVSACSGVRSWLVTLLGFKLMSIRMPYEQAPLTIEPNSGWETGEGPHYQVGT